MTKTTSQEIISLKEEVNAAYQEFGMAIMFHEIWKPSAYDEALHQRMGVSYATNAFQIIRTALRREMLLAIMRLWDKDAKSVRIESIARKLAKKSLIASLAAERTVWQIVEARDQITQDIADRATEIIALANKYSQTGSHRDVLERLQEIRNTQLAHRQIKTEASTESTSAFDEEIENFYQDNAEIIRLMMSVVLATAYDPKDAADVFQHHAFYFWSAACGERTQGHPHYRAKPSQSPN
jgi:hypothetical protein